MPSVRAISRTLKSLGMSLAVILIPLLEVLLRLIIPTKICHLRTVRVLLQILSLLYHHCRCESLCRYHHIVLEPKKVEEITRQWTSLHQDSRHCENDKTVQPEGLNDREAQNRNRPTSTSNARRTCRTPYAESQHHMILSKRRTTTYTTRAWMETPRQGYLVPVTCSTFCRGVSSINF
jgi:hypothetical protein